MTVEDRRVSGAQLASGRDLKAGVTVNCAGAWASQIARTAGVAIPVVPIRRQIFAVDTQVKPERPLPLTLHPSGLYLRSESGGLILCGKSLDEDPVAFDFRWERERFMDVIWPELTAFVPAFESLKLIRGWAGLYEVNTLDLSAFTPERVLKNCPMGETGCF